MKIKIIIDGLKINKVGLDLDHFESEYEISEAEMAAYLEALAELLGKLS